MIIIREEIHNKILNWAIIIAVIANIISFGSFGSLLISSIFNIEPETREILRVATMSNPFTIDPLDSWDSVSNDIIDQVAEPLLAIDITDPTFPIVGRLAESWVWLDNTTIEFTLRENVFFHDGQRLSGEDVIHTFERINYFGNWSGTILPPKVMAFPHSLYKFGDGIPIFNDTLSRAWWDVNKATDPLVVRLYLNRPFGPAEGLLSYTASYIVGHESTPKYDMLELGTDLLIGTGPFKLISYIPNSEVRFARWERYWRTGSYWDQIIYVYYNDAVIANYAMLAGDIDWLGHSIFALKQDFIDDPEILVTGDGIHDYINGTIYWYIAFNSLQINLTWRKAICYAFNYSFLIHNIKEDRVVRAHSLVPPGFPAHNASVIGGIYNIPYAREIMQSMGFGYTNGIPWDVGTQVGDIFTPGANETLWQTANFIPNIGNFTGNNWKFYVPKGSSFMADLIQRFAEDMDLIGINVIQYNPCPWWDFCLIDYEEIFKKVHLIFLSWGPDYFETFTMIDPFVNPESPSNFGKINNTEINALLAITQAEIDTAQRYEYYKKLQYLIHDKYYYHMPLMYDKLYHVHAASLKGIPYNCMRNLYWYPTYRE